ncbi:MAG: hypothetical protein F9K29_24985 [Hyphomicrobiaceae bacterium]|nr:MAG: hypothetical protein F9K29_24985 [Hyphomicrobiaceae bacterium]
MRKLLILGLMLAGMCIGLTPGSALAQQRWAAIDPNSEVSSSVVWADTEDKAREAAMASCKRVSKSCAGGPASTNTMSDIFAVMCCTQPRLGCAIYAGSDRQDALNGVKKIFADANYSNCTLRHYLSAGTGRKE